MVTGCVQVLDPSQASENDCLEALKLVECCLANCKGRIDEYVPLFVNLVLRRLREAPPKSPRLRTVLIEQISHALHYNAAMTFQILEAAGATQHVFEQWFKCLDKLKRVHDKKVTILGLASILQVPERAETNDSQRRQRVSDCATVGTQRLEAAHCLWPVWGWLRDDSQEAPTRASAALCERRSFRRQWSQAWAT